MSWFDAWLNGDVALSGWFPTIFIFLLGLFLGRKRIKDGWTVIKTKIHNSKNAEKENIVAMNAGSIGTVNNYFGQGLQNQMPNINQKSAVYSVVNKLVDENVTLISFNQEVHGKENDILNDFSYIIQQYLSKSKEYIDEFLNFNKQNGMAAKLLDEKISSMLKSLSIFHAKKFDEVFAKLYSSSSYSDFLNENFVSKVMNLYAYTYNDQSVFSIIVENILLQLEKSDYNGENDCSRVLQVFWDSLDLDLKYKIAIAYYWIFRDSSRKDGYLQKKFAKEIYNELGFEEIVREMMRRELNRFSTEIEVIDFANKYQLDEGKIKLRFDDIFAKPNFDYESFKDIK